MKQTNVFRKLLPLMLLLLLPVANALASSAVDYSVTQTSGTLYKNGVTTGQSWSNLWVYNTSTDNPAPLVLSCTANNIGYTNGNLALFEGTGGSATYGLTVPAGYVITGYSFDYVNFGSADVTITIDGTSYTSSSTQQNVTVSDLNKNAVIIVLTGSNKGVTFKNFTVQIAETDVESVAITDLAAFTNGWYRIKAEDYGNLTGMVSAGTPWVINAPAEYRQSASNFYPLMFSSLNSDKPAESLVYVVKNGGSYLISPLNGHDMNSNCTVSRELTATNITVSGSDGLFKIGGYWSIYAPGDGNTYVGQSSGHSGNRYSLHSVNVSGYDIYTVTLSGVDNASEIGSDPQVECVNSNNLGIAKVYNNGCYFFPKDTVPAADDFVSAVDGMLCFATVDSSAKTIAVQYFEGYNLELYQATAAAEDVLSATVEGTDPGCYATADRTTLQTAIDAAKAVNLTSDADYAAAITTLNSAVEAYYAAIQGVKYSTDDAATWYYIISDSEHTYCNGLAIKSRGEGTPLTYTTQITDPAMVWCFEQNSDGMVAIRNYAGGYMAANQSNGASTAGMTDTPAYTYTVAKWSGESPDGLAYTLTSTGQNPLHAQQSGTVIVTWGASDDNASLWRLVEVTADELASTAALASSTVLRGGATTGIGNTHVPLLRFQFTMEGLNGTPTFDGVSGALGCTAIDKLYVYGVSDAYEYRCDKENAVLIGETVPAADGSFAFDFDTSVDLPLGTSDYYWLVADISSTAAEGTVIDAEITDYTINGSTVEETAGNPDSHTTVFLTASTVEYGNTHDSRHYRIPAITTAMNGWLVAVTDKRFTSNADLPNNIDVVARVSKDNGRTWSEPVTIAGTDELGGNYGHGDPAIVTDRITGDIVVLVTSKKGFYYGTPDDPARLKCIISHDNGVTWDAPVDVTDQIYGSGCSDETRSEWYSMFFSSGAFLQTSKGTLMCVAPVRTSSTTTHSKFEAQIIRSDDHGKTWTCNGVYALTDADESKIVELNDGTLLVKSRNQNRGYVYYATSDDDGASWSARSQFTDVYDPACNGDIIRYTSQRVEGDANRLLLSIPDATSRKNVTVYMSTDEAGTWPVKKTICPTGSAYSSMTILEDGTVGIYYEEDALEGGYQMRFASFSLEWLTDNADSIDRALFDAARVKEAQALAVNLPQIADSVNGGNGDIPVGEYENVYNVTTAIENDLTAASTSSDLQTIQDAITAYMATYSSQLVLPRDGKVYRIKSVIDNTDDAYKYHYLANNGTTVTFPTEADNSTTLWVCQQSADGNKRTFVSAAGDYSLAWKGLSETALEFTVSQGISTGVSLYNPSDSRYLAVTNEAWGTLGFNQSTATMQSANWSTDFAFEEVSSDEWAGFTAKVNEGSTGNFGTLNLPFAVTMPEGVVANSVSLNDAGTELGVSEAVAAGSVLPANTPVLLTSDNAGIYTFVPAASSGVSAVETGMEGTLAAKTVSATNAYIMAYTDGAGSEIKFFKLVSGSTVNANKAYYLLPEGLSQMPSLRLNNSFTGIEGVGSADGVVEGVYDLTGRKLDEITAPGVYIVNGKKILVK